MVDATHISLLADDRSYFSLIKKDIHKLAAENDFPKEKLNEIDLIASELTSNLQKHTAGAAEILYGYMDDGQQAWLEIISLDSGPGIPDVKRVLTDGYSSSSTLGHGFGSIKRMADLFEIYSVPKWGTVVLVKIYKNVPVAKRSMLFCPLIISKPNEVCSGDGTVMLKTENGFKIMVADGLGHGPHANEAANAAAGAFAACTAESATETIRFMHASIKKTRGVVSNILLYNNKRKEWNICGVGNISTRLWGGLLSKNYVPYNGIIGHNIPNSLADNILPKSDYSQFISCSDGIKSRWDLQKFPMIHKYDPAVLCAALYKEYGRRTDDMSVVYCKLK